MVQRWRARLHRAEDLLLATSLLLLVLLASLQIALRMFFDTGLLWADPASRTLVMWVAMLGALAATREGKHIAIDALPRVLPEPMRRVAWVITQAFAALVSAALAWYCWVMLQMEREAPVPLFGDVPSWAGMIILPLAFGLMALRFALSATLPPPGPEPLASPTTGEAG